jgi:nicotinate phosphoribosyltransferase
MVARAGDGADGADPLVPVAKRSVGKPSRGGRKWAVRQLDETGTAVTELVTNTEPDDPPDGRRLLRLLVRDGEIVGREPLAAARARHQAAVAELPSHARQLSRGYPAIPTVFEPDND